jgi:putative ABC transport system ATP-binding protein
MAHFALTWILFMLLLENVKKSYSEPNGAKLPVLDIPRLHLAKGERMALLGRSGCGKTTLLHIIAGIGRADAGTVQIHGRNIAAMSEAMRDRFRATNIGYVFQTFNLLPGFSALENVLLGMTFASGRKDRRRAEQLLDRVGLSKRATHRPGALSVGEQQRVAVARSLANRPKLLLADEPTANVDPGHQQDIIDLILEVCDEEQVSLLMVTHTTEVAEQFKRTERLEEINRVGVKV